MKEEVEKLIKKIESESIQYYEYTEVIQMLNELI
jgi:hypothetical protein